jgi:aspartate/methionine/tyrosine aminotransferase
MNGAEFCKKAMHEAGVAIVPGTAFGKTCNDYVRFSLLPHKITFHKL